MERNAPTTSSASVIDLVRVLVLIQGGIALVSTIEVLFWASFVDPTGTLGLSVLLTGGVAVATLVLAAGLGRRFRPARRMVMGLEAIILLFALVDLGLAVFMADRLLGLVPLLTRVVLPITVIVLLHRRPVRAAFRSKRLSSTPAGATS
jgi:hypothetical protein